MPVDQDQVQILLKRHETLCEQRRAHESLWRQCERWADPYQQGGFYKLTPGYQRDQHLTDDTAVSGLETFVAAMQAMLLPDGEQVTKLWTTNQTLNAMPKVQKWLAGAAERLHACRNAPHTGFASQSPLRWRQLGLYGTGAFWTDENVGIGLSYRTLHLSEIFIDDDFRGMVDTIHRRFRLTARAIAQMFHDDAIARCPKVMEALRAGKVDQKFHVVHVVRPNSHWEAGRMDIDGFPIQSLYVIEEDKTLVSARGFYSPPLAVSRYTLAPNDPYGVGPTAMKIGTIKMLNQMGHDYIRATHLNLSPPVLVPEEGAFNRMSMTPGAGIPGGMINGKRQMEPFLAGVQTAYAEKAMETYQAGVEKTYLTNAFAIMQEPIDRQTATEYLGRKREAMALQAPNVGRQLAESLTPQVAREMDILLRAGQIDPPPGELREARAGLRYEFVNPFTTAAKSAEAQQFLTGLQALQPLAEIDPSAMDVVDTDAAPRGVMLALGVRADWLADPDQVIAKRQLRAQQQQQEQLTTAAPAMSQAMLNMAQAGKAAGAMA
ncbi:portal protein [Novosphingobium sp. FSW06-99]|uniref:portal protein n=1 Tax=Novosphingobium sp. FSW06-99 TaxID=1739113 RepID=UPI00076D9B65|nr:portal protein [Novosphingobium sp. FSW06-99]KUR80916.1 hypothetical protein AQZ49_02515 [Novosphingobium sp. FSW06-99]